MEDVKQGSPEWKKLRSGKITASRFSDLLAEGRNGQRARDLDDLLDDVVLERYTGEPVEDVSASALIWGKEVESFARAAYEAETGSLVEQVAFVVHPDYAYLGCSPDGLVAPRGGVEIKCPKTKRAHLQTLRFGMPKEHEAQVQGNILCARLDYMDFVSYHPSFPPESRLFIKRVYPDAAVHAKILSRARDVDEEAGEIIAWLRRRYPGGAP